jgi:hypothetical protein
MTGSDGIIFIACGNEDVFCDIIFLDCDADRFLDRTIYNPNNHV